MQIIVKFLDHLARKDTTITIDKTQELEQELINLELKLVDLQTRLPAHSIPPQLIAEMDDIDEQIRDVKSRIAAIRTDEIIGSKLQFQNPSHRWCIRLSHHILAVYHIKQFLVYISVCHLELLIIIECDNPVAIVFAEV